MGGVGLFFFLNTIIQQDLVGRSLRGGGLFNENRGMFKTNLTNFIKVVLCYGNGEGKGSKAAEVDVDWEFNQFILGELIDYRANEYQRGTGGIAGGVGLNMLEGLQLCIRRRSESWLGEIVANQKLIGKYRAQVTFMGFGKIIEGLENIRNLALVWNYGLWYKQLILEGVDGGKVEMEIHCKRIMTNDKSVVIELARLINFIFSSDELRADIDEQVRAQLIFEGGGGRTRELLAVIIEGFRLWTLESFNPVTEFGEFEIEFD